MTHDGPTAAPLIELHRRAGAHLGDGVLPADFGDTDAEYRAARETAALFGRTARGVLDLVASAPGGPAADNPVGEFLDRIVSSHAARLGRGGGQRSCLLTAKGRLLGAFALYRLAGEDGASDAYRAVFPEALRESVVTGFRKYGLLSDVDAVDRTADVVCLSIEGPRAGDALAAACGGSCTEPGAELAIGAATIDGVTVDVVRLDVRPTGVVEPGGLELWVSPGAVGAVWEALAAAVESVGGRRAGGMAAEILRIEAGRARFGADRDEDSFPGEVCEDGALTYDKCYVGQEIVARTRTYGHVNRRLFHVLADDPAALVAGIALFGGDAGGDATEAGRITSSCRLPTSGRGLALASIRRDCWEANELRLESGAAVELRDLSPQASA